MCGERTWKSSTCDIENVFEQLKAFSLQIEARLSVKKRFPVDSTNVVKVAEHSFVCAQGLQKQTCH